MAVSNFQILTILVSALLVLLISNVSSNDASDKPALDSVDPVMEDQLNTMMDSIMIDLTDKYQNIKSDEFWHQYTFGSGNVNREVIRVENIDQHHIPGDFIQWKASKLGLSQFLLGLQKNSFEVYDSQLQKIVAKDVSSSLNAMEVFSRWDVNENSPVMIIMLATSEPSLIILKSTGKTIQELGSFPLNSKVKNMMMCRVSNNEKVVLVPENSKSPISIYSIDFSDDASQAHVWFSQRFPEREFNAAMVHQPDTMDSILIISKEDQLKIYNFDAEAGQFDIQQTLQLHKGCSDLFTFTMMYQHYVGCTTSDSSQLVHFITYDYNMNEYFEKDSFGTIAAADIFPVAVTGSRDDLILIRRKSDGNLNVLTYDGEKEFSVEQECTLDACGSTASFTKGASFTFDDSAALVLPTAANDKTKGAPVIVLFTDIFSKPSPTFEHSMGLFDEFKMLSKEMTEWRTVVKEAESVLSRSLKTDSDNVITGNWNVHSISTEHVSVEGREANSEDVFNVLKFGDVQWTEEDFASTNDKINSRMIAMDDSINAIMRELQDALLVNSPEQQVVSSSTILRGGIIADTVAANTVTGGTLWGQKTIDFLGSLAQKGNEVRVNGVLSFDKPVTTGQLFATKINDVEVGNFARLSANNVFQCTYSFESIQAMQDLNVGLVNGRNLAESVVMPNNIDGFRFVDGIVAYRDVESVEKHPFEDVFLKSVPQTMSSEMVFTDVEINAPVSVGQINGRDFKDFLSKHVTKNHQGKIRGLKTFTDEATLTNMFISGKWNGLSFPQTFISSSNPLVVLSGEKSFSRLVADKVFVKNEIDGVNTDDTVSLSSPDTLNAEWDFTGDTKILNNIAVEHTVDGILMEHLPHEGTLESTKNNFDPNGDIEFASPLHVESLKVHSTINGKNFDEIFGHLLLFDGTECVVPGHTTISGDVVFADMQIENNEINSSPIQNFLTKSTVQTIKSPVSLSNEAFFEEMYSLGHFDTVWVQDVVDKALRTTANIKSDESLTSIPWDVHFNSIECKDNLRVAGAINGVLNYGLAAARTRGIPNQVFVGPITTGNLTFKNLGTTHLNLKEGRTLQTLDVMAWKETRAKLSEPTTFTKPMVTSQIAVQSNMATNTINGISLEELQHKVFRTDRQSQIFEGPIEFQKGLKMESGEVIFHDKVNGFDLNEIVKNGFPLHSDSSSPISIDKQWQFESIKTTKGINVNGNVCGVDLNLLQSDSVKRSEKDVQILGEKSFSQPIQVFGGIMSPRINNVNFQDDIFLLHEEQDIKNHASFTTSNIKGKIQADSINNLPISWLSDMYSFQDGCHVLNNNVKINDGITSESLSIEGNTQGRNFDEFLKKAFKPTDSNIAFSSDVLMKNPITVENDVQTNNYNGININDLSNKIVRLDESHTLDQPVVFTNSIVAQDTLSINGNLESKRLDSNVDWNNLVSNAVRINDANNVLNFENIQFDHLVASSPLTISNLNGKPFDHYATTNTVQDMGTLKIAKVVMNSSSVDIKGKMGAFDISEEFKDTLMANHPGMQRLSGDTVIKGPVHVMQDINCFGSEFKKQVVTTHHDLTIRGPVEFSSPLTVLGEMKVTEPIQGHSVESIFSNVLTTEHTQVISENWEFQGPVTFKQNVTGKGMTEKVNIQALVERKQQEVRKARSRVLEERNSFQRRCNDLHQFSDEIANSPMKLDLFDLHQTIALQNEGSNVLTVGNADSMVILVQATNCQLTRYRWQTGSELFHKVLETPTNIGNVESWQSVSNPEGETLVVFSKSVSDCSRDSGLSLLTLSAADHSVPLDITKISDDNVKSFKMVLQESTGEVMLFTLFTERSKQLDILRWDGSQFSRNGFLKFDLDMERVDVTATSSGFQVMCHNKDTVHMYQYIAEQNQAVLEISHTILASTTAPLAMFNNFQLTYALVPESGASSPSMIQPTCNFQLMRFVDGVVQPVQKIQVPEVISATHLPFAEKNFMVFLSKSHGLTIHKFRGLSGFEQLGSPYKIFGGQILKSFTVKVGGFDAPRPFLLVLSRNNVEIYNGKVFGDVFNINFEQLCKV
ncbi:unnamed protein product [Orchesella dallaii]|uniref:Uncharacterized protein n=1 Tax=Orchesella dallaii TaxID=48710 RepID=A0ABP1PYQ4_9HEXA